MADHVAACDRARHPSLAHLLRDRLRQGAGEPQPVRAAETRPGGDPQRARRRPHPRDLADGARTRDPRQGDRRSDGARTAAAVLPEERRAGNPDRPAAATARESRRRDRPEQHLIEWRPIARPERPRRLAGRPDERQHWASNDPSSPASAFSPRGLAVELLCRSTARWHGSFHNLVALTTKLSAEI